MSDLSSAATRPAPSSGACWFALFLCAAGAIIFLWTTERPVTLGHAISSAAGLQLANTICRQVPHCHRARIDRIFAAVDDEAPASWHLRVSIAGATADSVMIRATITRLLLQSRTSAFQQQAHDFLLRRLPAAAADQLEVQS